MSAEAAGLATLNEWLSEQLHRPVSTAVDEWEISTYRDALLFSSGGGRRSNTLFLVRNDAVLAFSPAFLTLEDAYGRLAPEPG